MITASGWLSRQKADVRIGPYNQEPIAVATAQKAARNTPVEPPICSYSSLCGNRRLGQFVEQRLGLFQVGGVEAFGEPAEDWGEQGDCLLPPALLSPQAGEAHSTAQFPGLRVLPACDVDTLLDGRLGLARCPGAGEQCLALEAIKLRFKRRSPRLFNRLQPGGDRCERRFGLADRQLRIGLECQ